MKIRHCSKVYTVEFDSISEKTIAGLRNKIREVVPSCASVPDECLLIFHNKTKLPDKPELALGEESVNITDESTVYLISMPQGQKAEKTREEKPQAVPQMQQQQPPQHQAHFAPQQQPGGTPGQPPFGMGMDLRNIDHIQSMINSNPALFDNAINMYMGNMPPQFRDSFKKTMEDVIKNPEKLKQMLSAMPPEMLGQAGFPQGGFPPGPFGNSFSYPPQSGMNAAVPGSQSPNTFNTQNSNVQQGSQSPSQANMAGFPGAPYPPMWPMPPYGYNPYGYPPFYYNPMGHPGSQQGTPMNSPMGSPGMGYQPYPGYNPYMMPGMYMGYPPYSGSSTSVAGDVAAANVQPKDTSAMVEQMVAMGFRNEKLNLKALKAANWDISEAVGLLTEGKITIDTPDQPEDKKE